MRNKKQIKQDNLKKNEKERKRKINLTIIGIILFVCGMIQVIIIGIYIIKPSHNNIVYNDEVVTTEVCSVWMILTQEERDSYKNYYYKNVAIPKDVMNEVCQKWQNTKNYIDKNGG